MIQKYMKKNPYAFEYAKKLTAEYSKSFYISTQMLPSYRRWATFALYGFCRYADNIIDKPRNRTEKEIIDEIDAFNNELQRAYRTGESEHPIISAFVSVAHHFHIPIEYPLDLIKGVKMDMQIKRYNNFDELYVFAYRVAGVVGLMMTHVLGYTDKKAFIYAEKLGIALQLTNILRDVQEDKNMGRIYLPQDELVKFGIDENDINNDVFSEKFKKMMEFQIDRAKWYYKESDPGIYMLNTESQFAIKSASKIYKRILDKIEQNNHNPFLGRVYVPQLQKFGILFQEVLRTKLHVAYNYFWSL